MKLTLLQKTKIYDKLNNLHPNDKVWHNEFMFTKPVYYNWTRQGRDVENFWAELDKPENLKLFSFILNNTKGA